ncbi:MAG: hypothetical protein VX089_02650 [Pseudomonadota bacterium]|nr:hypothetical protein [Pseudomonadota bacterium]
MSCTLEVGFGMGDNFKNMIDIDQKGIFIGCDPYLNGLVNLLTQLQQKDYERVKIFNKDVRLLFEMLPRNFFSKIIILFPDPWPKRRHKKRRLLNEININYFLKALEKNGVIYFGTDSENYFSQVREFFLQKGKSFLITNSQNFTKLPSLLCKTKYAKKAIAKGLIPKYLVVKKKVDIL